MNLKKVKVGVVQATPALFDIEKTVEIVCMWIEKAAQASCGLLLFPDYPCSRLPANWYCCTFNSCFGTHDNFFLLPDSLHSYFYNRT